MNITVPKFSDSLTNLRPISLTSNFTHGRGKLNLRLWADNCMYARHGESKCKPRVIGVSKKSKVDSTNAPISHSSRYTHYALEMKHYGHVPPHDAEDSDIGTQRGTETLTPPPPHKLGFSYYDHSQNKNTSTKTRRVKGAYQV